jgi:uncharacterized protein
MNKLDIIKAKIEAVEEEIRKTPYDKSSEHHHGVLKAKLARLRDEPEGPMNKGGGGGVGYAIKHSGDASIVLVGLPSVGKSTLLNKITNAESKIGNYDFTTLGVIPGMLDYKGVKIQILDLPGIIENAATGKGFGRKVLSVVRASDMVILMTDYKRIDWLSKIEKELYDAGIRVNTRPPRVSVRKMPKGSLQLVDPYKNFSIETVTDVANELGFSNAIIQINEKLNSVDQLIDALVKTRKYLPLINVVNKVDEIQNSKFKIQNDIVYISADKGLGIEELKERIWQKLGLVRVYLKRERTGEADKNEPLIIKNDKTVKDVLNKISTQMGQDITRVFVWGKKVKFAGQEVSFSYQVFDEMELWFGR